MVFVQEIILFTFIEHFIFLNKKYNMRNAKAFYKKKDSCVDKATRLFGKFTHQTLPSVI